MAPPFPAIRAYFRSGWAFFIPYLAAYLLYAWLKWPVNPIAGGGFLPPPLLHVYWALHAGHFVLAIIVLRSGKQTTAAASSWPSPEWSLGPWLCLGLIFWIPGFYLEWPSDPWEHLRRINEWQAKDAVAAHSVWGKSSYFLLYSVTGASGTQLMQLNFAHTAVCLLLGWQYYRLARAVGLGERASFIFVLLNAITFGNSLFSFYRYYGLASTIVAQLAAVAVIRLTLDHLGGWPASGQGVGHPRLRLVGALLTLGILIAFNHPQGLGIAGLGVVGVLVWRLNSWRRASILWLAAAAVVLSLAVIAWFPRLPETEQALRSQGWLTAWQGFNLLPGSPAFDRTLHILGVFGWVNLAVGLWLVIRHRHVAGWLTVLPVIALLLPCFALPFAHLLVARSDSLGGILTFHRVLFAVPMGLALVAAASQWRGRFAVGPDATRPKTDAPSHSRAPVLPGLLVPGALLLALSLPAGSPGHNRLWHSLHSVPDDLRLRHYVAAWTPAALTLASNDNVLTICEPLRSKVREVFQPGSGRQNFRQLHEPLDAASLNQRLDWIYTLGPTLTRAQRPQAGNDNLPAFAWIAAGAAGGDSAPPPRTTNLAAANRPWVRLGGSEPEHEFRTGRMLVSNPVGKSSGAFSPVLVPLDRSRRYQLASSIRQTGDRTATNYLAVAWYDANGRLLASNAPFPGGADNPPGWSNGTHSYFGLNGQPAPPDWTVYLASFGLGEPAAIPVNAAFFRAGAFLNYQATPGTTVTIANVTLRQKAGYARYLLASPSPLRLFSPQSIAGQLSHHWRANYVAADHAGSREFQAAVSRAIPASPAAK